MGQNSQIPNTKPLERPTDRYYTCFQAPGSLQFVRITRKFHFGYRDRYATVSCTIRVYSLRGFEYSHLRIGYYV